MQDKDLSAMLPLMQDGQMPETLHVKTRHGPYYVLANDLLISTSLMYYGEFCQQELDFMLRFIRPGDTVLDIGANLGGFTIPLAQAVGPEGHVMAFEPQPVIYAYLKANVFLNRLKNVALHCGCLGDMEKTLEIPEPDYNQEANFGSQSFAEKEGLIKPTRHRVQAPCQRLDALYTGARLDFIKMDVEGMEYDVLRGAETVIATHRPILYFENNRVEHSPPMLLWLMQRGYRLWWHTSSFFNPDNFTGRTENVFGKLGNINMIALPDDRYLAAIPKTLLACTDPDRHIREPGGKVYLSE